MVFKNSLITVVLPLYKPKGNWAQQFIRNIHELENFLPDNIRLTYIVVYDDAADLQLTSLFGFIVEELPGVSFISYDENRGKGFALREGVRAADTSLVITMDFDFPYMKENIAQLISLLQYNSSDIVIGKRSSAYFGQVPLKRKIISKFFSFLNRVLLDLPVCDTQSGMKGFNKAGKEVFLQTTINRFLVDTEFVLRGARRDLRIRTIDIELRSGITFSSFGFNVLTTEFKNFIKLLWLSKELKPAPALLKSYSMRKIPAH